MFVICHVLTLMKTEVTTPILPKKSLRSITRLFVLVNDLPHCFTSTPKVKQCKISTCPLFIREKVWLYTLIKFSFFFLPKLQLQLRFGWNIQGWFFFFNQLKEQKISTFLNTTTLNTGFSFENGVLTRRFCVGPSWNDAKEHNMSTIFLYKMS